MKQKIKRILFKLFTLGILLISISCEKEEYDIKKENNKVRIKEVKFENLLKEPKFKNLIENFSRNSISNRTAFENQYGFTIVNNNVKIIETDLTTSYTMLIERDENINNSSFENLVIQEYRFYRYLFLTTVKCLFILIFVPFIVNFVAKTYLIKPLTEYYWSRLVCNITY